MIEYSTHHAGTGYGWFVISRDDSTGQPMSNVRTVAGPYTSEPAAQRKADELTAEYLRRVNGEPLAIVYRLTVTVPANIEQDTSGIWGDVLEDADDRDVTTEAKIRRHIGGQLSAAETYLADALPEGWGARVDERA